MLAQLIVVLLIAAALVVVWYGLARMVATLAASRGEDEAEWFRLAVTLTPMLALLFLVTNTPPPGRR